MYPGRPASGTTAHGAGHSPSSRAARGSSRLRCGMGRPARTSPRPLCGQTRPRCSHLAQRSLRSRGNAGGEGVISLDLAEGTPAARAEDADARTLEIDRFGKGERDAVRGSGQERVRLRIGGGEWTGRWSTLRRSVTARSQQGRQRDDACQAGGPGADREGAMLPSRGFPSRPVKRVFPQARAGTRRSE